MTKEVTEKKQAGWDFQPSDVASKTVLVVVYDLEDFTSFLQISDIQRAARKYLNFVDEHIRRIYEGGSQIWANDPAETVDPLTPPIHRKFLGDGAMMIFDMTGKTSVQRERTVQNICIDCWLAKQRFARINRAARAFMPNAKVPKRIRFGITFGTVYELARVDGEKEYIGYPINLASRLQKLANAAGLLISARVNDAVPHEWFQDNQFTKVLPANLTSGDGEYLYIDAEDLKTAPKGAYERVLMEGDTETAAS